jgi:hypothetical protein
MAGIQQLLLAAKPAIVSDPNFEYTTLLLPGNGTNGAQNNTFLDSSTNNFTITRNGNTTQGTFSPFSQTGWGNYFSGSSTFVSAPANAAFSYGTGDFTYEAWIYPTVDGSATTYRFIMGAGGSGQGDQWLINNTGDQTLVYGDGVSSFTTTNKFTLNAWNHVALSRNSGTLRIFINGVLGASGASTASITLGGSQTFYVGNRSGGADSPQQAFVGYMSNVRVLKGVGLYTANFTPPTTPLTAISGTSLLTCQSNRFVDNSSNNFTISRGGDTSIQAFSPFNPTAAWSAATYGGSGYFDGSGDYLTAPDNAALNLSGDFTVEAWVYVPNVSGEKCVFHNHTSDNNGIALNVNSAAPRLLSGSGSWDVILDSSIAISANSWNHIAGTRSGNTYTIWVNGQSGGTATSSATPTYSGGAQVGRFTSGVPLAFSGYTANVRVVKGTAVYTTAFTPPTAPLTAITNTSLLLNFTNAGIYDATSKNDLETVGNAQISTTQSKFGGSSMAFDGTGDYVASASSPLLALGTGNLTVEFWFRASSVGTNQRIVQNTVGGFDSTSYILRINGSSKLEVAFAYPDVSASSTTTIANDTWYHVAMVRNGTSVKVYLNGVEEMSGTSSGNMSNQYAYVGGYYNVGPAEYFTGYVQDVRITKGIARYTAAFTPPTTAFPLL